MSPEDLMHYYLNAFNEENLPALEEIYHYPHTKITNGKPTHIENKTMPVIDFDSLKKSSWKYSKINSVKALAEGANSALVDMEFSRFDKSEKEYMRSTTFYVVTKSKGYRQIISLNSIGTIAGIK